MDCMLYVPYVNNGNHWEEITLSRARRVFWRLGLKGADDRGGD